MGPKAGLTLAGPPHSGGSLMLGQQVSAAMSFSSPSLHCPSSLPVFGAVFATGTLCPCTVRELWWDPSAVKTGPPLIHHHSLSTEFRC